MSITTAFFDLDDTLCATSISRIPRAQLVFNMLLAAGHAVEWEPFLTAIHRLNAEGNFIAGMDGAIADLGLSDTPIGRKAVAMWFYDGCEHLIQPCDGVLQTLEQLASNYTLGIITNGLNDIQARKHRLLCIEPHLPAALMITSEMAGCYKPDEAIFRLALERAGVSPHHAVMIGDNPELDVIGAQAAGLRAIWFNPHGNAPPEAVSPDATIRRFAELPALLHQWT